MCGPVAAEIVAGARGHQHSELWQLMNGLPWAELGRVQWRRVGEVAAALRSTGTAVALTGIEIAVAAADADAALWSRDSDFDRLADAMPDLMRFIPQS